MSKPRRAFTLTLEIGADTRDELVHALHDLAHRIERDEVSRGCWGSPSNGAVYELLVDESQTHDKYFEAINKYLEEKRESPA